MVRPPQRSALMRQKTKRKIDLGKIPRVRQVDGYNEKMTAEIAKPHHVYTINAVVDRMVDPKGSTEGSTGVYTGRNNKMGVHNRKRECMKMKLVSIVKN
ncbi:hypothetical protein EVAR_51222_1 [Eumeta japonica]|uniref:Uncharacterized protein n=1 Tax=Eumeta variegata TaxID=151549 RepID=A0A4C1ZD66_EUMVA|nr:hypothetical protein EVAR_51222_1 [Eumeta japonica]